MQLDALTDSPGGPEAAAWEPGAPAAAGQGPTTSTANSMPAREREKEVLQELTMTTQNRACVHHLQRKAYNGHACAALQRAKTAADSFHGMLQAVCYDESPSSPCHMQRREGRMPDPPEVQSPTAWEVR